MLWAIAAIANVGVGMWLATGSDRTDDLLTVVSWSSAWLRDGANLYSAAWSVDYPPHAIVALAPLSLLPATAFVSLWVALNVILALIAPTLTARVIRRDSHRLAVLELTFLFLCWSGAKIFTQYSLLTLVFGLFSMLLADARPGISGVCLGLSLMKPQMAIPFVLSLLTTRRWRPLIVAIAVVFAGWMTFALRAGVGPVDTAIAYIGILRSYYTGATAQVGASSLQPLLVRLLPAATADLVAAAIAGSLLLAILGIGIAGSSRGATNAGVVVALGGAWSLLTFYHLTYGFVLLLPTAAWLRVREDLPSSARTAMFWLLQALLIVDVPGLARRMSMWLSPAVVRATADLDRIAVLLVFVVLAGWAARRERTGAA